MKYGKWLSGAVLGALAGGAAHAAGEINFTQVLPLTGAIAVNAAGLRSGAEAYIGMVNAGGGVNGATIKLSTLDDGYKPDETVQQVKKALTENSPPPLPSKSPSSSAPPAKPSSATCTTNGSSPIATCPSSSTSGAT